MKKLPILLLFVLFFCCSYAQYNHEKADTITKKTVDSVLINAYIKNMNLHHLPDVSGMLIFSGKKTNLVDIDPGSSNLSQNVVRTIFAKIPGQIGRAHV